MEIDRDNTYCENISDIDRLYNHLSEEVSGRSVSTYPMKMDTGVREGEPICDR